MLRLRQQISGDPGRRSGVVSNDHRLGRTRQPVNADHAKDLPLGKGDEEISRSEDFIHRADGFCAVGKGGNCLRPAQRVNFLNTKKGTRGEGNICHLACGAIGRDNDHNLLDARYLSRHSRHDDGGRQRRGSAWHIQPNTLDGADELTQCAVALLHHPRVERLAVVETAHPFDGNF